MTPLMKTGRIFFVPVLFTTRRLVRCLSIVPEPNCSTSETLKMKSSIKIFLLIPVIAWSSVGVFANRPHFVNETGSILNIPDTGLKHKSRAESNFSSAIILHGSLVGFNASYGKNFFELNWNSLPQSNCDHFEIERSLDGTQYEKLGEIKGVGNQSQQENYSFRDNVRPSVARKNDLYYRLKQVDVSGHISYSKILIARMYNTRSLAALSITPDPVINDILVNVQLKESSFVVMKVTDQDGNEVIRKSTRADYGYNTYQIDGTHQLQPGTYFLEVIINSNERMQMKLIKS
jgi:hypothetical protein